MNGRSWWARTKVVAQAAAPQPNTRPLDNARTSGAPVNERYEAQRATTRAGVR